MAALVMSEEFAAALDSCTPDVRLQVHRRLQQLVEDPTHPSLQIHRIDAHKGKWEFYVNRGHRVIFERSGEEIRLWKLGPHEIIDRLHWAVFSPHTAFRRVQTEAAEPEPETVAPVPDFSRPAEPQDPNRFSDLPAAHLRILGVPAELVKPLQKAPTASAALALPGLPESTKRWLEELLTDPDLERKVFDEGRLLYRTTLDRLEGYCKGSISQLMLNLTADQQQYVTAPRAGTTVLKGVAGSGKTTVGIYRAIEQAGRGRRVLMLTYSKTLNAVTRSLVESLIGPLPENLQVVNIDRWVADYLAAQSIQLDPLDDPEPLLAAALDEARQQGDEAVLGRPVAFFREEIGRVIKGGAITTLSQYLNVVRHGRQVPLAEAQRRAVWRVYEGYQRRLAEAGRVDWRDPVLVALERLVAAPLAEPYDDVIVDEGQDLTAAQLRLAQRLIKGRDLAEGRTLLILGDAAQTIYSRGFSWRQAGIRAQGATFTLRVNHRNTRQIAEAAARLLSHNRLLKADEDFVAPEATRRMGPQPLLITCDVEDRELRAVRERILSLVADGQFRVSDFAVLAPRRELCQEVRNDLLQASIPAALYSEEEFDVLEEQVKVLTIHSAKGLEFPVVLVLGLREGVLPDRRMAGRLDAGEREMEIERQRTLLYVAMTRAAEALYLVSTEAKESFFLGEVNGATRRERFAGN